MSDVKYAKNYQASQKANRETITISRVEIDDDGEEVIIVKTIPMLPTEVRGEDGTFGFVGWRPLHGGESAVKASGTLVTLSADMTADYRDRSVSFAGKTADWVEHFPVATKGENKGQSRVNPIRIAEIETEVSISGNMVPVVAKVILGGADDRVTDTLSLAINRVGTGAGRTAKAPADSDDAF